MRGSNNMREDDANLIAGRIMQKFDTTHPEVFKDKATRANMGLGVLKEDALGSTAANAMGAGGIEMFDPMLRGLDKKAAGFDLSKLYKKKDPKQLRKAIAKP